MSGTYRDSTPVKGWLRPALVSALGAFLGALILGGIGSFSSNEAMGAITGVLLGSAVGLGYQRGWVGGDVALGFLLVSLIALVGMGVDDYGGRTAFQFGIVWAVVVVLRRVGRSRRERKQALARGNGTTG